MDLALKQRLVGAIVLIALGVIFLPMILDGSGTPERLKVGVDIPEPIEAPESSFEAPDVESELARDEDTAAGSTGAADGGGSAEADGGRSAEAAGESAVTGWVVQVGSFTKDANAVILRDRLRDKGFAAFVSEGEANGEPVWRVQVGPFPEEDEAREIAGKLEAERGRAALVMSYP